MPQRPKALLSWSTGKDSAWALHVVRQDAALDVVGLLTTVNADFARVAMHGVREALLDAQAASAGLPVRKVAIPRHCTNAIYEDAISRALVAAREEGVTHVVFGDLFLSDIRAYREAQLSSLGLTPVFPLWERGTRALAAEMTGAGLRAILTCVDPRQLDRAFAGRTFDADLVAALPSSVDPCGENGEFHTFACAGPMFAAPIAATVGETVERDGFVFTDLLPA